MAVAERIGNPTRAADIAVGYGDAQSVAGKCAGGSLADTAGCPGYNRDPFHVLPPALPRPIIASNDVLRRKLSFEVRAFIEAGRRTCDQRCDCSKPLPCA